MTRPRRYERLNDAAERLCINPKTLRRRISDGTIVGYRIGRLIMVDPEEVDQKLVRVIPSGYMGR
ncbi:helix-turn-helix domain-containing protein [Nocardioides cavernaquae]|uniref:DNA-binding protein n=1 Tax=Nocardioides cavernaquae TaxID=2321396 RepID=A0A3A5HCZ0_9ACTN|nr:helix-turn-helix domain-containing protein [Nocardioides cavernaquae]RJS47991.1 DNA-binding protein [Nocardioides cavernaquae]